MAHRLDSFFSERLVYRVGETLQTSANDSSQNETVKQLEVVYHQMNQQLVRTLAEIEQSQEGDIVEPFTILEKSILETKAQIAEKERVGNIASSEMSDEDLRQHFASLKRLRSSLASMQYKLDRLEADESEKAEAKQKLPEVHERWIAISLESKQRFIRAATSRISLEELDTGWLKLTIEWSALLGDDVIDEAYIWTTSGQQWTDEEKNLVRDHYKTADRQWILEQLPDRGWDSIVAKASKLGLGRPYPPRPIMSSQVNTAAATTFSIKDWQFMQTNEIPVEIILKTRIYWRE